jgi:hypothetical protein
MPYGLNIAHWEKECFDLAFGLAFKLEGIDNMRVKGFKMVGNSLHLLKHIDDRNKNHVFSRFHMNLEQIISFVWGWLQDADYGKHGSEDDGSYKKGFKIRSGNWCDSKHGGSDDPCVFAIIDPVWFYFGK